MFLRILTINDDMFDVKRLLNVLYYAFYFTNIKYLFTVVYI